jgi:hypothetical protein
LTKPSLNTHISYLTVWVETKQTYSFLCHFSIPDPNPSPKLGEVGI